jgi:hypothetical protein
LTACPGTRAANSGGPDISRDGDPAAAPVGLLVLAPLAGGPAAGVLLALGAGYAAVPDVTGAHSGPDSISGDAVRP